MGCDPIKAVAVESVLIRESDCTGKQPSSGSSAASSGSSSGSSSSSSSGGGGGDSAGGKIPVSSAAKCSYLSLVHSRCTHLNVQLLIRAGQSRQRCQFINE